MQNQELPTAEDDDWHRIKLMIRNLKRAVLPSTHAHQILDEDKEFLKYLWKNNVTPEARKAILLLLGQAVKNVDLAFEKWRTELQANARSKERRGAGGASDSRERLQLVVSSRFASIVSLEKSLTDCPPHSLIHGSCSKQQNSPIQIKNGRSSCLGRYSSSHSTIS